MRLSCVRQFPQKQRLFCAGATERRSGKILHSRRPPCATGSRLLRALPEKGDGGAGHRPSRANVLAKRRAIWLPSSRGDLAPVPIHQVRIARTKLTTISTANTPMRTETLDISCSSYSRLPRNLSRPRTDGLGQLWSEYRLPGASLLSRCRVATSGRLRNILVLVALRGPPLG